MAKRILTTARVFSALEPARISTAFGNKLGSSDVVKSLLRSPISSSANPRRFERGSAYSTSPSREQEASPLANLKFDMSAFPAENVRNFSIIAHVDHGKSTLADRLLELTATIRRGGPAQYLDKLQVEKDRGITVKAQTVTLVHEIDSKPYLLNLIDTPGHVDFSYEVSRSLSACQGVILLVDAAQGIQAQTVANFYLAFELDLAIIPVLNKIDVPTADPERCKDQLQNMFDIDPDSVLQVSAKTGKNLPELLRAVIEHVPPPRGSKDAKLQVLLFDCFFDEYRGVICLVEVINGVLQKGDQVISKASGKMYDVLQVGVFHPEPVPTGSLHTGQVGYIITGMKTTREARIGDTFCRTREEKEVEALPGFRPAKSMVYAGLYPLDASEFDLLRIALEKLTLNDASIAVAQEATAALGMGFRCGFLGLLHMDVVTQRLEQEYNLKVVVTPPTVPYEVHHENGTVETISNPSQMPPSHEVASILEPTVIATIITPQEYVGGLLTLCSARRGEQLEYTFIDDARALLKYRIPLPEIVTGFYDELKSKSSGYASLDYEEDKWVAADVVQLSIRVNGEPVDAMTTLVHRSKSLRAGKDAVSRFRDILSRQLFQIAIQAVVDNRVIARETLSAMRKDVLAKCYGGDVSRKRKLLEKQKEGKKRMKRVGNVEIPQEAFVGKPGRSSPSRVHLAIAVLHASDFVHFGLRALSLFCLARRGGVL
ncbi:hypothetical protein CYMTET_52838 [Cymbomonas tetramitiformis]|uniref:Translation factor GUF1 homolog, mitochondrial n=1 Tax=Cymbomonas tetramitiformis TaxID=36881 RepID=A0AAE0ER75_9CHLO|nr:hypothetical protein CYMTET_52838 [Cymbomonas tetramitiformis]